ncbi:unnamed protein product [Phytophthora lilii]|uniref:Unnamed protein product n=1 Tax=Phytophthora lilii TaxID=2077276 RepID=A0A9W7D014_9STRA|nr:unnamed protein product [Phytophthora lilii]
MVKLFCAVVGAAGSAFPVEIDASELVGDLKEAIKDKKKNDLKKTDADRLELYLAKKGDAWLTENEVKEVRDTSGLKHLDAARARLRRVGLSDEDMVEVDEDDEAAGNGLVNVLVVVPTEEVVVPAKKNSRESENSPKSRFWISWKHCKLPKSSFNWMLSRISKKVRIRS